MNNKIDNKINEYNELEYLTSKVRFSDYMSNKYNIIHERLYNAALNKYIEKRCSKDYIDINTFKKEHLFLEIKGKEYWQPSQVYIKQVIPPFNIEKINLKDYWDTYQYVDEHKNFDEIFFEENVDINGLEVIKIDYIKGKVKFRNKYSGTEFWKDFKFINEDTVYNEDLLTLKDTFTYKLQNKIYGR